MPALNFFKRPAGKRTAGYTLVELSIVLVVAGVIVATAAEAYRIYLKDQQWSTTVNNSELAVNALDGFLARYGRYPCPARLDAVRTDADYGMEGDCSATGATVPVGTCASGVCVEETQRTDLGTPAPRIRRGALPFRILNIPEQKAIDGYNTRLQYVVTESLTQTTSYNNAQGGISIIDERPQSVIAVPDSAHFVVFSTGADRAGAYSKQGQLVNPCNTGTLDAENCNTDATNLKAIYRLARQGAAAGAAHFDDILRFYSSVNTPLWRTTDQNGLDISTMDSADAVGIGMNPGTGNKLEINGQVKSTDRINTGMICDPLGADCFTVEKIAGNDPYMQCSDPAQPYVARIWGGGEVTPGVPYYGKVECTAVPSFTCPPGQVMTGVSSSGTLKCVAPNAGCPAIDSTICDSGVDVTLGLIQSIHIPAGVDGQTYTAVPVDMTPSDPNDYQTQEYWKCVGGTWVFQSWNGKTCGCSPSTDTYTAECYQWYGGGVVGTFTGQVTTQYDHVCPANTTTSTQLSNTCVCTPTNQTRSATCPLGYTGSRTESRDWTCLSSGAYPYGTWSAWTETANNCVCQPTTDSQTVPCASGWTGQIQQHRTLDCSTLTWSGWIEDSNTCSCTASSQTQTVGCSTHPSWGAGYVGNVTQSRSFDCATSTWSAWGDVSNTCTSGSHNWVPLSTPQGPYATPLVSTMAWNGCTTAGATGGCSQAVSGGYYFYQTCSCQ